MTVDNQENLIINIEGKTQLFNKEFVRDALKAHTIEKEHEKLTFCARYNRDSEEQEKIILSAQSKVTENMLDFVTKPKEDKALRYDEDKIRHDLIPAWALNELGKVYTFGAKKYADNNWRKGMKWSRVLGSLKRHLNYIENGEDFDTESNLYHVAHVAWNAITLLEYYKIYPQGDDRPHNYLEIPKIGLDIDEVLCDFTQGWSDKWGNSPNPDSWNYDREMGIKFDNLRQEGKLEEFYLNLNPKISPSDIPFEPHCYVTSRPIDTKITEQWLSKHGFPEVPVYTVPLGTSKVEIMKTSGIDIFVDDRFENFVELNKAGICCYLMDAPHNQRYDVGFKRIKSLKKLI